MPLNVMQEVQSLQGMTVPELQTRHAEVFGEPGRSRHKQFLIRRIAWRLQANAEGGLTERAKQRAAEIADDRDLRTRAPATAVDGSAGATVTRLMVSDHDNRLPMPGSILSREYQGCEITVRVLDDGFDYEGKVYRTLTAVVKAITGSHWNGFHFFGLGKKGGRT